MAINRVNVQSHIYKSRQYGMKKIVTLWLFVITLQGRPNEHHGVSNHRRLDCFYSTVCAGEDQRKHQSSAPLAFVLTGEFPAQRTSNAKNFPFDDVIMHVMQSSCLVSSGWNCGERSLRNNYIIKLMKRGGIYERTKHREDDIVLWIILYLNQELIGFCWRPVKSSNLIIINVMPYYLVAPGIILIFH